MENFHQQHAKQVVDTVARIVREEAIVGPGAETNGKDKADGSAAERAADGLIVLARTTAATIRFIEDPSLLDPVGGVGAFLRLEM